MKKTIKFFSMAALAMLGAMTVSCSSDNDELISEQPVNKKNLVTTTVTITMGDDATTRTLTDDGTTLSNKFAEGDKIVVFYRNATNGETARAESNAIAAGDINADGKSAKFTITLTDPNLTSDFRAVYPSNMAKIEAAMNTAAAPNNDANTISYEFLGTQDGTLATIGTKLNVAVADGSLTDGKVPSFTLDNKLAIAKFKIKDNGGNDITSNIEVINIHVGDTYYQVQPTSQSYIYVAMKPVGTSETITFDAGNSYASYNRSVTGKELKAGHISPIKTMYLTVDNATETDKGKLICTDGHIHAYNADAGCTKALCFFMISCVPGRAALCCRIVGHDSSNVDPTLAGRAADTGGHGDKISQGPRADGRGGAFLCSKIL